MFVCVCRAPHVGRGCCGSFSRMQGKEGQKGGGEGRLDGVDKAAAAPIVHCSKGVATTRKCAPQSTRHAALGKRARARRTLTGDARRPAGEIEQAASPGLNATVLVCNHIHSFRRTRAGGLITPRARVPFPKKVHPPSSHSPLGFRPLQGLIPPLRDRIAFADSCLLFSIGEGGCEKVAERADRQRVTVRTQSISGAYALHAQNRTKLSSSERRIAPLGRPSAF